VVEPVAKAKAEVVEKAPVVKAPTSQAPIREATIKEVAASIEQPAAVAKITTPPKVIPAPSKPGVPVMNVPNRPATITPAGPRLEQPKKTTLAGPKVIRVEAPEEVPAPRRKPPVRTGGPMARGGPRGGRGVDTAVPDEGSPIRPGVAGRKGDTTSRRNKRRSATAGSDRKTGREGGPQIRSGNWREQDLREREQRLSRSGGFFKAARRDNLKRTAGAGHRAQSAALTGGKVLITEPIAIKSLSSASGVKAADIVKSLFLAGKPAGINSNIDSESAIEVMLEFGIELEVTELKTAEEQIQEEFKDRKMADERPRSPVVTILGHVDHGKTSLLDRIRKTNVAEGEAGGITQATSAFSTNVTVGDNEHSVTFIDTPGHEAFTSMRARGANMTDIVVLVVAADDGIMPQTIESINHAKAAGVPVVVALNKIDKPEATDTNIQRILGQLAEHELNPVEWGGSTEVVRTSALENEGIQDLLDILDYQAELLGLTADFGGQAEGVVLEAKLEEGRGPVANVLVQQGKLKKSDFIVVGRAYGRVRDIIDDRGQRLDESEPSSPVAFSGINLVPDAGDRFYVVKNLKAAEAAAGERQEHERTRNLTREKITLDNIFEHMAGQDTKELPLIVKTDVQGSLETLKTVLEKIKNDEVAVSIKHAAVGGVNDSDIILAATTGAIIIGFNVTSSSKARKAADAKGVDVRLYDVIYDITDDVTKAAEGLLAPELKLEVIGHAEVRDVFKITKVGMIAGCYVTDGVIERNAQIRVTRDDIVVEKDRRLEQLKRFKDDAKEVRSGQECGMKIEGYDDIKVGDVLECYKTLEIRRTLND
ncbi:MAG: translation initiation factor IF-2, partial [Planctomycetota bacterium]|nr:translation initiation factor IF-2 [Planctomycetota bacterium]